VWIQALVAVAVAVGGYLINKYLHDHRDLAATKVPVVPRVDQGAPIPLIYGRCRVRAPILVWYGGQRSARVRGDTVAYWMDMLYLLGAPFNGGKADLVGLFINDIPSWIYPASEWSTSVGGYTYAEMDYSDFPTGVPTGRMITVGASSPNPNVPSLPRCPGSPSPEKSNYFVKNTPGADLAITVGQVETSHGFLEFFNGAQTQVISTLDPHWVQTDTEGVLEIAPFDDMYAITEGTDINQYDPPRYDAEGHIYYTFRQANYGAAHTAEDIPSYRGFAMCCLYHWCHGATPSLALYSFDVRSLSTGTPSDLGQSLAEDADPAAVIYDLLTSPWGKLGISVDKIDRPSFVAASVTLFNEHHGYSHAFEDVVDASEMIAEVLKQIDGSIYEEPTTGLLVLKLVRNDYNVTLLSDANPDNAMLTGYAVQGWNETVNQVRLTFTDRQGNFQDALVIAQNSANAFSQARVRSADVRYPGCSDRSLAQRLASRDLAVLSTPFVRATLTTDRTFYLMRPLDVMTMSFPELGVVKMPMRVSRVDLGSLHNDKIVLEVIRDAFGVTEGAYPTTFLPT